MTESAKPTIAELAQNVEDAGEAHRSAERACSTANSHETDCRNRLDRAQKAFDERVAAMRGAAPMQSDWGQARLHAARRAC